MIDAYDFGWIVINRKRFNKDLIIFSDKVKDGWWRKEGHQLHVEDLKEVLNIKPEVLVVGTGYSGMMKVPLETVRHVESEGIELVIQRTAEACETFNRIAKSRKAVAALHLTC